MWTRARRARSAGSCRAIIVLALAGCAPATRGGITTAAGGDPPRSAIAWADSVLATLTPRERAAQLVWPQVFGDYAPDGTAGWERVRNLIGNEKVGGFVLSIGSPLETASKL